MKTLHVLARNRVNRQGQKTADLMQGQGRPENWDMFAERLLESDAVALMRILEAVHQVVENVEGLEDGSVRIAEPYFMELEKSVREFV